MEDLLCDLYVRPSSELRHSNFETATESCTDASYLSEHQHNTDDDKRTIKHEHLMALPLDELRAHLANLRKVATELSMVLIRQLKRRDHQANRRQCKYNLITAALQAYSQKRNTDSRCIQWDKALSVDAKLQFSLEPPSTRDGYSHWLNAMQAVAKLPDGIPQHFRKKLWITLAGHYVDSIHLDWPATVQVSFSDRVNADDNEIGSQIIKDLHRTGWSGLSGDQERVLLKRVLLAYARYNKQIGYCQGFNVIAAVILEVVDYNETDAFKVMILFVEHVLPRGYFDHSLRALSVDMAVLGELMEQRLPTLSNHLKNLQANSDSAYEPPVTNVFSMQWLLTLYATCLPRWLLLRVWDALLLDGSEILLRTSLAIWARIAKRVGKTRTADEFYSVMGSVSQQLLQMSHHDCNHLMQIIYTMAEFPYPGLAELREKYTWNIQPFSSGIKSLTSQLSALVSADSEDDGDNRCLAATLVPAADKICASARAGAKAADLGALQKQYKQMKQRQRQAAVILQNAYTKGQESVSQLRAGGHSGSSGITSPLSPPCASAFNHLYIAQNPSKASTSTTMNGVVALQPKVIQPFGNRLKSSNENKPKTEQRRDSRTNTETSTVVGSWSTRSTIDNDDCPTPTASTRDTSQSCPNLQQLHNHNSSSDDNQPMSWSPLLSALCLAVDVRRLREATQSPAFPTSSGRSSSSKSTKPAASKQQRQPIRHEALFDGTSTQCVERVTPRFTTTGGRQPSDLSSATKKSSLMSSNVGKVPTVPQPAANAPNFNPFPTRHTSRLIATEKKLGLY